MRYDITIPLAIILALFLAGCQKKGEVQHHKEVEVLFDYFKAFNAHNTDSLLKMTTSDIRLMSITPDTLTVDLAGKEELRKWLDGYFSDQPNVHSSFSGVTYREPFVSFIETVSWGPDSARKQQSSLATYQFKDARIHRVWYYFPE